MNLQLTGLWRRSLIAWPDGRRDTTTRVRWLQGIGLYADLRQPVSLPAFAHVSCLDDMLMCDCAQVAAQEAFAGRLSCDGAHYEWARRIDFQPKSPTADAGSLEWDDGILVERGRDVAYVEHWHRDDAAATAPCGAVRLRESVSGTAAVLLRVGPHFMFARDRSVELPAHRTLRECIDAAPTIEAARSLVDCEISTGLVETGGFRITASTLPFRCGHWLEHQVKRDRVTTADRSARGTPIARVWDIVEGEGNLDAL